MNYYLNPINFYEDGKLRTKEGQEVHVGKIYFPNGFFSLNLNKKYDFWAVETAIIKNIGSVYGLEFVKEDHSYFVPVSGIKIDDTHPAYYYYA